MSGHHGYFGEGVSGAYQTSNFAYQGSGGFAYQDSVGVDGLAGGAGYPVDWQVKRRKLRLEEQPEKHLRYILDQVVAEYYGEIVESDLPKPVKAEAAAVVRPFAKNKGARTPQVESVDWKALQADVTAVNRLIRIWNDELAADEDDELILMMVS